MPTHSELSWFGPKRMLARSMMTANAAVCFGYGFSWLTDPLHLPLTLALWLAGAALAALAHPHATSRVALAVAPHGARIAHTIDMRSYRARIVGACLLNVEVFEEVEADSTANAQAGGVVVLAGLSGGLGAMGVLGGGVGGLLFGTILGVVAWVAWASLTFAIGTRVLPESTTQADTGQLLRTLAFAAAPGLGQVLGVFQPLRGAVFTVSALWMFVAMVVAVRQALDYRSTLRAVAVCVCSWALAMLIALLLAVVFPLEVS